MAIKRQLNIHGNWRLDVPHLRSMFSSLTHDFDMISNVLVFNESCVVRGFNITGTNLIDKNAEDLHIAVADGAIVHPMAAEPGSFLTVPQSAPHEVLSPANPKVEGNFVPNSSNYIGLEMVRVIDPSTSDVVYFLTASTLVENPYTVPLARVLEYRIIINQAGFDDLSHILPLAIVETDEHNRVSAITDARPMLFSLASGGNNPSLQNSFIWPSRKPGGDREIVSLKASLDAIKTRLWEIGGGDCWHADTADRNVRIVTSGDLFPESGKHFRFDGSKLYWKGIALVFENSDGWVNEIKDELDGIELAHGECIYVDIDRGGNRIGGDALDAQKGALQSLGSPNIPGSRYVIAWRYHDDIYTRDGQHGVGNLLNSIATTEVAGAVKVNFNPDDEEIPTGLPIASVVDNNGRVRARGFKVLDEVLPTAIDVEGKYFGIKAKSTDNSLSVGVEAKGWHRGIDVEGVTMGIEAKSSMTGISSKTLC
jgi:hypothetical protein